MRRCLEVTLDKTHIGNTKCSTEQDRVPVHPKLRKKGTSVLSTGYLAGDTRLVHGRSTGLSSFTGDIRKCFVERDREESSKDGAAPTVMQSCHW